MSIMPDNAVPILAHTLTGLLGPGSEGNMAFLRCLPGDMSLALADDERFEIPGWRIATVTASADDCLTRKLALAAIQVAKDAASFERLAGASA